LDELSEEFTALLTDVYSNKDILPTNLVIIPGKKVWTLHVDALILSEDGNILDILFLAAHAALYDCQIPTTRSVQYKAQASIGTESGLDTRPVAGLAADFELKDYWDSGEPLSNQKSLPIAITLQMVLSPPDK
jgi:exosome complex component RRP42